MSPKNLAGLEVPWNMFGVYMTKAKSFFVISKYSAAFKAIGEHLTPVDPSKLDAISKSFTRDESGRIVPKPTSELELVYVEGRGVPHHGGLIGQEGAQLTFNRTSRILGGGVGTDFAWAPARREAQLAGIRAEAERERTPYWHKMGQIAFHKDPGAISNRVGGSHENSMYSVGILHDLGNVKKELLLTKGKSVITIQNPEGYTVLGALENDTELAKELGPDLGGLLESVRALSSEHEDILGAADQSCALIAAVLSCEEKNARPIQGNEAEHFVVYGGVPKDAPILKAALGANWWAGLGQ